MISPLYRLLGAAALLLATVGASPVPEYFERNAYSRGNTSVATIQKELGPKLSSGATIYGPSSPQFANLTHRWNTIAPPDVQVVVQAGAESDVPIIVQYCNSNSLEFLAVNRGHGFTTSLGRFKGVQIDLKKLTQITINKADQTAVLQGGTYDQEVMDTLWAAGYYTPTGSNSCPGVLGPGLGGGHGRLEGLHGLILDNLVHLNVVLANGSTISVNSTSHSDLFWGMRGAGHNFGIVTHFKVKIHPRVSPTWYWANWYWSQDKLEKIFTELNKMGGDNAPPLLGSSFFQIYYNDTYSKTEPILWLSVSYNGPASAGKKLFAPFDAIPAVYAASGNVPYPEIVVPQGTDPPSCGAGNYAISTRLLKTYNLTTERTQYNLLKSRAAEYPDLREFARLYYEGYAVQGMRKVNSADTAYAHRDQNHLVFFLTAVPDGREDLKPQAVQWALDSWNLWIQGAPGETPAVYTSYATGNPWETVPEVYSNPQETWRVDRLKGLKAKYDPHNRFRYYVPIIRNGPPSYN